MACGTINKPRQSPQSGGFWSQLRNFGNGQNFQKDADLAGKLRTKKQYKNVLPCAPMCSLSHWSYGVRNSEKCMWLHVLAKEGLIWGSGGALCSSNSCTTCCSHPSEHLEVSRLNSRCPRCSSCWHYCGLCLGLTCFLHFLTSVCGGGVQFESVWYFIYREIHS